MLDENVSDNESKKNGAFKLCWEDSKKIFNNTWNQHEKPVEIYRTDFISAMKVPDHQILTDDYIKIRDSWKQEYDKGVQVPVDIDNVPQPSFNKSTYQQKQKFENRPWKLPKQYITWTAKPDIILQVMNGEIPEPEYDMDEDDLDFLKTLNHSQKDINNIMSELQCELIFTYLDAICHINMMKYFQNSSNYSVQHDDSVHCEVCKDIYSEPENEMVFCDSCNICVHQSCYGITKIPCGEWYCSPCKAGCFTPVCLLCMQSDGAFKGSQNAEWIHVFCALWIPEVGFGNIEKMEPITKIKQIHSSRWSMLCCFCQERIGTCIQCCVKNCYVSFHPTCAYENRCYMMTIYGVKDDTQLVQNLSYCSKHSKDEAKKPVPQNGLVLPFSNKNALNPLYNEQCKILNQIQLEFYNYIDILDVSTELNINVSKIQTVFDHWKKKRLLNGNNPLIELTPLAQLVAKTPSNHEIGDDNQLDPFFKLVSLRQDLERARVLVHMSERRERLKKRLFKSTLEILELCFLQAKPLPFKLSEIGMPTSRNSSIQVLKAGLTTPDTKSEAGTESISDENTLNISQTSLSKIFSSPLKAVDSFDMFTTGEEYIVNNNKENTNLIVAQEVVIKHTDIYNSADNESKDSKLAYNYRSSEDPEWHDAKPKSRKRPKKSDKKSKLIDDRSKYTNKVTINLSEKSDVQSSQDELLEHYTTPPTSPEFDMSIKLDTSRLLSDSACSNKRKRTSESDDNNTFVLANTPPSPTILKTSNVPKSSGKLSDSNCFDKVLSATPTRRTSKRMKTKKSLR